MTQAASLCKARNIFVLQYYLKKKIGTCAAHSILTSTGTTDKYAAMDV